MILELENISKSFGKNAVLRNISLKLESGRFYALLGKNGSGKSTLLKLLMRFERPTNGSGKILGYPLDSDDANINLGIAYVSEEIVYGGSLTLSRFFRDYNNHYPSWDKTLFEKLILVQKLDLNKSFNELSRGQKMQVALAAGLAIHPKIILLDEITSVLDAGARSYFLKYLHEFKMRGGTIIMATNIVSEVQQYAEQLLLLEKGSIFLNIPIAEISQKFVKFRRRIGQDISELDCKDCIELNTNTDNTISYIVPKTSVHKIPADKVIPDNRHVTIEELFIYFTSGKGEQK